MAKIPETAAPQEPAPIDDVEALRRRKEVKRLADAGRPLDSWEQYRALNDAIDEAYELIDIANREARFALILAGVMNAGFLLVASRPDLTAFLPANERPWLAAALVAYALVVVYFFHQAIETLRPRRFRPQLPTSAETPPESYPLGLRYYEDVIQRDIQDLWRAWREVNVAQLNAELAAGLHSLARTTQAKRVALRRLYTGLQLINALAGVLLAALVFRALIA